MNLYVVIAQEPLEKSAVATLPCVPRLHLERRETLFQCSIGDLRRPARCTGDEGECARDYPPLFHDATTLTTSTGQRVLLV